MILNNWFIYPQLAEPVTVPVPEINSEDKWHQPWSEPVRQKITPQLATALAASGGILPPPQIETISADKWFEPLSEPVRTKQGLPAYQHQTLAFTSIAPIFAQSATFDGFVTSVTLTYPRAPLAGDTLICAVRLGNIVGGITVSDNVNGPWTTVIQQETSGNDTLVIAYLQNCSGSFPTVSVNWTTALISVRAIIADYTMVAAASVDQVATQVYNIATNSPATPTVTTLSPLQILIAINEASSGTTIIDGAAGSNPTQEAWTDRFNIATGKLDWDDANVSSIGAFNETWSAPVADTFATAIITLSATPVVPKIPLTWFEPLSEPPRRVRQQAPFRFFPIFVAGETITPDKWFSPFAEPVRQRPGLGAASQQVLALPAIVPETITVDKWFEPLSEPVRRKDIAPDKQQVLAFAPSPITPSFGWFAPLTEPARRIPRPPISDYVFAPSTVTELITVDKWFEPLAEPAKPKLSISTASQQAFASIVSPIIPSFGWYAPLAEPVRRAGIQPSQQQTLAFVAPIIVPTVVTGWFTSFSDPVWPKRQTSGRPYPFQARSQYISWFAPFSEPVRLKPDLGPHRQQFFAEPAFVPPPFTTFWFTPLSEPVRLPPRLITGSNQDLASLGSPIIPSFGWFEQLSEPTRRVASQASQQALAVPVTTPTAVTTGWLGPLSDPYLRRPDPNRYQGESQFIAVAARVKWFSPLAEPVRTKPSLSIASQPSVAQPVFTPVVSIGWFTPLAEPVRFRTIPVSQQPAFSFAPLPITPSFGWFQPLNEPAKRFNLPAYQQQTLAFGTYAPIIPSFGYFNPLSQFPGVRRSLLAAHQQFWTYGTPAIIVTIQAGMAVVEQGDFLQAVLYQFNIPLTCYVDIIEKNPHYVGDAGIIEKGQQQGILASIVEPVPVGAGGAVVPQVAGARVAIISAANPNIPLRPPPPGFTYLLGADGSYLKGADGSYLLAPI